MVEDNVKKPTVKIYVKIMIGQEVQLKINVL